MSEFSKRKRVRAATRVRKETTCQDRGNPGGIRSFVEGTSSIRPRVIEGEGRSVEGSQM